MKKKTTKKTNNLGSLVKVEWEDHYSCSGWQKESDESPVIVTTVGHIVKETPKMLVLAQSYSSSNSSSGNHMGIIKKCIKTRKEIK